MAEVIKYPQYRIYKPNMSGSGAASALDLTRKEDGDIYLFWIGAQQTGKDKNGFAAFGWKDDDKKVTIKLELVDLGEILACLEGRKPYAGPPPKEGGLPQGLFHKTAKGNSSLQLTKKDDTFHFRMSKKVDGKVTEVKHAISLGEASVLKTLLTRVVVLMQGWESLPPIPQYYLNKAAEAQK